MNASPSLTDFLLSSSTSLLPSSQKDVTFHLETWLKYKIGAGTDPDRTEWDFYRLLWPLIPEGERFIKFADGSALCVTGDWMCSVATTLREGLSLYVEENSKLKSLFPAKVRNGIGGVKTYVPILLADLAKKPADQVFHSFYADSDFSLNEFIRQAYTRANLIIVPRGLNQARGLNSKIKDYWDSTLEYLFLPPEDCSALYEFREPFKRIFKVYGRERLFLVQWLNEHDCPIQLPNKKPTSFAEWKILVAEMTSRIENRRTEIENYLNAL